MNSSVKAESRIIWVRANFSKTGLCVGRKQIVKAALLVLGFVLLGVGLLGVFLPGIPTTGPVLGAAFCFTKSYPPLEAWLREHKWFCHCFAFANQCAENPVRTKAAALVSMWLSVIASSLVMYFTFSNPSWPTGLTLSGAVVGTWCVCFAWNLGMEPKDGSTNDNLRYLKAS